MFSFQLFTEIKLVGVFHWTRAQWVSYNSKEIRHIEVHRNVL